MRSARTVLWAVVAAAFLVTGTAQASATPTAAAYRARLTQIDVAPDGAGADAGGFDTTALSADGRWVAFVSSADNLVSGDTNGRSDVFVRDTSTGHTVRASVAADGRQANGDSENPSISADGRYVAFASWASDLVAHDTNRLEDVFVRDLVTHTTVRVDVSSTGEQAEGKADPLLHEFSFDPLISANGRQVVFTSYADNLVGTQVRLGTGLYRHTLGTRRTDLVDVDANGRQWPPGGSGKSMSADNRLLAYLAVPPGETTARLVIRDLGSRRAVYQGAGQEFASMSADGRYLAYCIRRGRSVSAVYERDLRAHTVTLVSATPRGTRPNGDSCGTSTSGDGRYVAFESMATDMTPNPDHNGSPDVYLWDRARREIRLLTRRCNGAAADGGGTTASISSSGSTVAILAPSSDLCGEVSRDHLEHYYVVDVRP